MNLNVVGIQQPSKGVDVPSITRSQQ